ncbi:MAG: hypothetical protein HY818_08025 [Acetobacterium woodii]|nr:hypothetical protein [Acetobacterium woodii]
MKNDQFTEIYTDLDPKKTQSIESITQALANGTMLIDIKVDNNPLYYHPYLSNLQQELNLKKESDLVEQYILDRAVLAYAKRLTLGMSTGAFLENAINGNVKDFKKDISRYAVDPKFNEKNEIIEFRIRLQDISTINLMKVL